MKNFILWLLFYALAIAATLVVVGLVFAVPELISEHASWVMWILVPVAAVAYFLWLGGLGAGVTDEKRIEGQSGIHSADRP